MLSVVPFFLQHKINHTFSHMGISRTSSNQDHLTPESADIALTAYSRSVYLHCMFFFTASADLIVISVYMNVMAYHMLQD